MSPSPVISVAALAAQIICKYTNSVVVVEEGRVVVQFVDKAQHEAFMSDEEFDGKRESITTIY